MLIAVNCAEYINTRCKVTDESTAHVKVKLRQTDELFLLEIFHPTGIIRRQTSCWGVFKLFLLNLGLNFVSNS